MTKRNEIKEIKKSEIHNSALELFSQKGYFQTSIADISKKANISKGLFYHYYSGKEVLFEEIIKKTIEAIFNFFPQNNTQEFSDEKLEYFINEIIIPSLENNKSQWKLLILLLSQEQLYEFAIDLLTKNITFIKYKDTLYRYFNAKGYANSYIEVGLFTSSLMGICIQYIINPSDFPVKIILEQFTSKIISKGQFTKKKGTNSLEIE